MNHNYITAEMRAAGARALWLCDQNSVEKPYEKLSEFAVDDLEDTAEAAYLAMQSSAPVSESRVEVLEAALREARPIIEEERRVCVDSYTVLYKGDPGYGTVTDPDALADLAKYDSALARIATALSNNQGAGAKELAAK